MWMKKIMMMTSRSGLPSMNSLQKISCVYHILQLPLVGTEDRVDLMGIDILYQDAAQTELTSAICLLCRGVIVQVADAMQEEEVVNLVDLIFERKEMIFLVLQEQAKTVLRIAQPGKFTSPHLSHWGFTKTKMTASSYSFSSYFNHNL